MTTPSTCPHCGAEHDNDLPMWTCGTITFDGIVKPSDHCRERQAHAATRAELADARRAEADAIRSLAEYRERLTTMTAIAEELATYLHRSNWPSDRVGHIRHALSRLDAARKGGSL